MAMSEPRYNLRRTPAPTTRGAETIKLVSRRKAPKAAPARGAKRATKEALAQKEPPRSATKKMEVLVVVDAKAKQPKRGSRAYKISELKEELSSDNSLNMLSDSESISSGGGEGGGEGEDGSSGEDEEGGDEGNKDGENEDKDEEDEVEGEGEVEDEGDGDGDGDGDSEDEDGDGENEDEGEQEGEEEDEQEYEPLLSAAKDAIFRLTPTIIKDALTLSSSARDAVLRLGRKGPSWGGIMSGSGGAKKTAPKRWDIDHVPVDINVKGSPIPRASSEEGGSVAVRKIQDRSGYRDGFGGARWEEVAPVRRNLSKDLLVARTSPGARRKLKTRHKRTAEEITTTKGNFMQAVIVWILLYFASSNNRVRQGVYGTFISLVGHQVLQNILGSATSALHTAITPIAETGIQLFTPQKGLLETRVRTSSAAAAAASLDLENVIRASQAFNNLTRPIVIGLIVGELATEANARSHWVPDRMRAKIYGLSDAFEDAFEDLCILTEAFKGTIRRVRERYTLLASMLCDQASAEMLSGLRLSGRNLQMLKARGQRNKYSGFTVQVKYKIARSALLREFNGLRTLSKKALKSSSTAMEKILEVRNPDIMVIEKVVEIAEPFVAGLEALDNEVYRIVMLFLHQEFVVENYDHWVNLDELFLKEKLEALFAALGSLDGLERLRSAPEE
ncbi:hypothetical protein HOY82DRAFT_607094 [Tuber indicum]|nr:hypothetical protein HOY82DRAFT_607094 [Tuber indicum]